ncbi:MAG: type pilus assembly protein PilN [Frankiaceae bacterium]|nr:type pilus assembly protein PilN [Frankiaceae bacterium]
MTLPNSPDVQSVGAPAQLMAPVMPRVNLMPPEIAEAARFRRFQLAMGGAVVAAVVIVGALYVHAHSGVKTADQQLSAARAQQSTLQTQLNSLASTQQVYADVAAKQAMLAQAMGSEVRWSRYLTDLSLKVPDDVWLTSIGATQTVTGFTSAAPGAAPPVSAAPGLGTPGIGSITFSGMAFSHDDVATWLDVLARERGFADPYFTNSTETTVGPKTLTGFSSSVVVTDDAKSGRYAAPAGS